MCALVALASTLAYAYAPAPTPVLTHGAKGPPPPPKEITQSMFYPSFPKPNPICLTSIFSYTLI
jgi:hypothetical protein